jgi:actin related protein 2/3 complex subunit 2
MLSVNVANRLTPASRSSLIDHLAMLKPTLFSSPFHLAFSQSLTLASSSNHVPGALDQPPESKGDLMIVNYRENEAIYIRASGDRVTVIFKTMFSEETDRVFGKVFLQVNHLSLCLFIWLFSFTTPRESHNSS